MLESSVCMSVYPPLQGVHILGTSADSINRAEDRHLFSAMLDKIQVDQPKWSELTTRQDAYAFAAVVGYPVSGGAWRVYIVSIR